MKKLILFALIAAAGYYFYTHNPKGSDFSLSTVDQNPIPKKHFFSLWTDVALKACEKAQESFNTSKERCEKDILAKAPDCERRNIDSIPDTIGTKADAKKYGHEYFSCIHPYYYCNGVEVKSEEEARAHCSGQS